MIDQPEAAGMIIPMASSTPGTNTEKQNASSSETLQYRTAQANFLARSLPPARCRDASHL
jgi:hypothetical protein